jgi:hypothetical protein
MGEKHSWLSRSIKEIQVSSLLGLAQSRESLVRKSGSSHVSHHSSEARFQVDKEKAKAGLWISLPEAV